MHTNNIEVFLQIKNLNGISFLLLPYFLVKITLWHGVEEVTELLRSLAALIEDRGLVPGAHMTAHNWL